MTLAPPPPGRRRTVRRSFAKAASPALRTARPETVPVRQPVSRGPRYVRVGIWAALAAGPLAVALALTVPRTVTAQAAPTPDPVEAARPAADPRGVAELFVDLWLRADAADPDSSVAAAVRSLAAKVELPRRSRTGGAPAPVRVMAVRSISTPRAWTVVVAVLPGQTVPAPDGAAKSTVLPVRYFAVSGSAVRDGGPVTVGGPPAEVAAPGAAAEPASPFTRPVPHRSALETSLGEFLRAYLSGGQGAGLERYLSPGLRVSAPAVAPYVRVDVEDAVADAAVATGEGVAADGSKARVEVRVTGEDKQGVRWPLMYRAEVSARAGRWEVSALEAGVTAPAADTVSAPSSHAPVSGGVR